MKRLTNEEIRNMMKSMGHRIGVVIYSMFKKKKYLDASNGNKKNETDLSSQIHLLVSHSNVFSAQ